jgi:pyrroline-5-carboxylate reductase
MSSSSAGKARELWLVGAGRMGSALLDGWIKAGLVTKNNPAKIVEPNLSTSIRARMAEGYALAADPPYVSDDSPRLLALAVKPQMLDEVLGEIAPLAQGDAAVLSIIAGRTIASIAGKLRKDGALPTIRTMPNTPAAIGAGITAAFAGRGVNAPLKAQAEQLLSAVGEVVWVDSEALLDAVTAVSGSGPAYVFHLVEALAAAGVEIGLAPETAAKLARATITGSAALLSASPESPEALRKAVTSPGGTTEAALKILMGEEGLGPLMRRAVEAALARAKELGKG